MKIAVVIPDSLRHMGGGEVFAYTLLLELQQRGVEVELYAPDGEVKPHRAFYDEFPFPVRSLPWHAYGLVGFIPFWPRAALGRLQRRHGYDLWFCLGVIPAGFLLSTLSAQVPVVVRPHGRDVMTCPEINFGLCLDSAWKGRAETLRRVTHVVANSESMAASCRGLAPLTDRLSIIPNGVALDRFSTCPDPSELRARHRLPADRPLLLTVGRKNLVKGHDRIPEIARRLTASGQAFHWLLVGRDTPELRPDLEAAGVASMIETREEISPARCPRPGSVPLIPASDLIELYQAADLLVFPSRTEGFPRTIIEAAAAGLPTASTRAPGCRDAIRDQESGLLVEEGDMQALADAIGGLLADPQRLRTLADGARAFATDFSMDGVAEAYLNLFQKLVG